MTSDAPSPPLALPDPVVRALADRSEHDLRLAVASAQRLLRERHDAPEVEALPGE